MLRKSVGCLATPTTGLGERMFTQPGESPMSHTGGLPFYGNIYAGRVDANNYVPQKQGGSGLLKTNYKSLWDTPAVRAKLQECPYFALCDQVIFHNMDPVYLDPGLVTPEEHLMLLLFSRSYYEKWIAIHKRPPNVLPQLRINYGSTKMLDEILFLLDVKGDVAKCLKKEYSVDDSCLISMTPDLWITSYLDPANLDHLSGRVLEFAGVPEVARRKFFLLLDQMRRIKVIRRDKCENPDEWENAPVEIIPFRYGVTLFDFSKYLGVRPYSGQLKVYDYTDLDGTVRALTLKDEDTYFDFLVALFYRSNIRLATLSDLADEKDNTCAFSVTVEKHTSDEKRKGRWF